MTRTVPFVARRLSLLPLGLVVVACSGGSAPDAGTEPSASAASAPSSSAPSASSSAAAAITHEAGTVPTAAPKREPKEEEKKLPPVPPKLEALAAQPTSRKAPPGIEYAGWLDDTHLTIPSPGRMEIVELPSGAGVSITTGAPITAWDGNAERLVTLDDSNRLVVWDLSGKTPPRHWPVEPKKDSWDPELEVAFSPDGSRVAYAGRVLVVWDTATGQQLTRIEREISPFGLALTNDEIVVSTNNSSIEAFRIADGKSVGSAGFGTGGTFGVTMSPDGKWAAGAAPDGHGMQVSEVHQQVGNRQLVTSDDCAHHVNAGFSSDSRRVYAYLGTDWVKGFDTETWKPYASYRAPAGRSIAAMADDLGYILTTKDDAAPTVVLVAKNKETPLERPFDGSATYVMTRNGAMVAGVDEKHAVRVWSTKTAKVVYEVVP
jgi:WD40 repeat protein